MVNSHQLLGFCYFGSGTVRFIHCFLRQKGRIGCVAFMRPEVGSGWGLGGDRRLWGWGFEVCSRGDRRGRSRGLRRVVLRGPVGTIGGEGVDVGGDGGGDSKSREGLADWLDAVSPAASMIAWGDLHKLRGGRSRGREAISSSADVAGYFAARAGVMLTPSVIEVRVAC